MGINTVLFDFDGTVADTNQLVINSWQHTYMTRRGKKVPEEEIIKTFGEPLNITMAKVMPEFDVTESIEIYRGYQVNHFEELIDIFPEMKECIIRLKEEGYNVGIVTSRVRASTDRGLRAFGVTEYIDETVSCEDTDRHKPDPEPVLCALRKFGVKNDEALMVGDSMFDIKCAHNAGVRAAMVGWALAVSEEDLAGEDAPDYIMEKADDIFDILKEVNNA